LISTKVEIKQEKRGLSIRYIQVFRRKGPKPYESTFQRRDIIKI